MLYLRNNSRGKNTEGVRATDEVQQTGRRGAAAGWSRKFHPLKNGMGMAEWPQISTFFEDRTTASARAPLLFKRRGFRFLLIVHISPKSHIWRDVHSVFGDGEKEVHFLFHSIFLLLLPILRNKHWQLSPLNVHPTGGQRTDRDGFPVDTMVKFVLEIFFCTTSLT